MLTPMTINTDEKEFKNYNGFKCYIVNSHRDDDYVEVFVPAFNVFILLLPNDLED